MFLFYIKKVKGWEPLFKHAMLTTLLKTRCVFIGLLFIFFPNLLVPRDLKS